MTAIKCKKSCEGTHCYWDRHPITSDNIIRCPTRYVPSEHKRVHVTRGFVVRHKGKNNGKRQKKKNRSLGYNDRSKRVLRDRRNVLFSQMLRGVHTIERPRSHVRRIGSAFDENARHHSVTTSRSSLEDARRIRGVVIDRRIQKTIRHDAFRVSWNVCLRLRLIRGAFCLYGKRDSVTYDDFLTCFCERDQKRIVW
jgi:hypothetical protein